MRATEKDGRFELDVFSRPPKKITGTRLATILGLNRWSTPFQAWCEITRAYSIPFEDTIYTLAGKAIEPKQIEYVAKTYGLKTTTPAEMYGENYFNTTRGDFFEECDVFGGMWDALAQDDTTGEKIVIECKTSKRVEDWVGEDGKVNPPAYYKLQAALYAHLLNTQEIIMVGTFLSGDDYNEPDKFEVNSQNTVIYSFKVDEEFPNFSENYIKPAFSWYQRHVVGRTSPAYDEVKDKDYLAGLRTTSISGDVTVEEALSRLAKAKKEIEPLEEKIAEKEKEIKKLQEFIKKKCTEQIGDNKYCVVSNDDIECRLAATKSMQVDKEKLKEDNLLDFYCTEKTTYRLTTKLKGE